MKKTVNKSESAILLRQKAEDLLKKRPAKTLPRLSEAESLKLIQELEVHQIELEMQNEELVLAKEKAEFAADKHAALYDFAPTGYFTLTDNGEIIELNLGGAKMLGKERMHLINCTLAYFISDDTKPSYNNFFAKTFKSHTKEGCEATIITANNTTVPVLLTGIASENGGQCFVTMVDISESKRAEEYREVSRIILQILNEPGDLHNSIQHILSVLKVRTGFDAVGIRLQDSDDFPYYAQDGFPKDFLLTENTLLERNAHGEICRDKEGKVCLECTCGLVVTGKTDTSMKLFTKGGSAWTNNSFPIMGIPPTADLRHNPRNQCIHKGYASIALIPIRTKDTIVGLLQFNDGHKDRLSLELVEIMEAMASHIGSALQRKQTEEKQQMYEERLLQTQKLESLGVLAGGIAHDFNNLMGGIFGYIDMASEASTENKVTSYLSKAMNTIERARALTQQLLTFAKGGAPIQKIDHLFPFVEETAKFALSGANVSCQFDVQDDLWACNFDKNQIGQVIDNLIINAQQSMPVGGTIDLTARNIALSEKEHPLLVNGNYVKISVKDTGVGIPKEHISKIFDPFFTTKAKGHGLGLATCYSIINRHGGCIDVESEPGKGSIFKVYLPASTEAASSLTKNTAKPHKGNGTFLIMDDEEVMRDTIGDMLKTLGYTVISKENGRGAIDFFASEIRAKRKIAGMIFDLTVPGGMGGKDAIEEIRKTNTDIPPTFVASGYADDPVMKNPTEYGFMGSICKPFRKSELSEMLNKYLKVKK